MTIFYFTGTGNSLAVAKRIGGNLISIPQVIAGDNLPYKDDIIGIVFPVYALIAPKMVRDFLDKAKFEADYLFAIGTYGNSGGSSLLSLQKQARKNGYSFDYLDQILMVDNCLPIFEIGAEIAKIPHKKTEENLERITKNIHSRKKNQARASLPNRALSAVVSSLLKYEKSAQKFIINGNCNKCGVCVKVCPAKNVEITSKVQFNDHCAGCQACLHLCPKNAIHLKNEKSDKRWRHPEVSLDEIIQANNRQ
ncbi:MAG: EFR1 family ferrodoxin [Defluviitaleaceae bacterium]|nr:EFR1 family ferrodoxin [Defluviitaleaceae bacterium]